MFIVHNNCTYMPTSIFTDVVSYAESISNIIIAIVGVVIAMEGRDYLNTLKEKRAAATFSFWIQLGIRIKEICIALTDDYSIINGLYSEVTRTAWSNHGTSASDDVVDRFYKNTQETLKFVKGADDQIPVTPKWLNNYREFVQFLIDVSQYDIRCTDALFKFSGTEKEEDRNNYCCNICEIMNDLLADIEKEQTARANELEKYRKKEQSR